MIDDQHLTITTASNLSNQALTRHQILFTNIEKYFH